MRNPYLNQAQRLLTDIKKRNMAFHAEISQIPMKIEPWNGKDSLDAFIENKSAIKYRPEDKATKLLGLPQNKGFIR